MEAGSKRLLEALIAASCEIDEDDVWGLRAKDAYEAHLPKSHGLTSAAAMLLSFLLLSGWVQRSAPATPHVSGAVGAG